MIDGLHNLVCANCVNASKLKLCLQPVVCDHIPHINHSCVRQVASKKDASWTVLNAIKGLNSYRCLTVRPS